MLITLSKYSSFSKTKLIMSSNAIFVRKINPNGQTISALGARISGILVTAKTSMSGAHSKILHALLKAA